MSRRTRLAQFLFAKRQIPARGFNVGADSRGAGVDPSTAAPAAGPGAAVSK